MNRTTRWMTLAAVAAAVLGCASEPQTPPSTQRQGIPGFLGDYSMLKPEKDASGEDVQRYVSPRLVPGSYQKLLLDAAQFYPAAQPSE